MKRTMVNNPLDEKNKIIRIIELLLRQKWYIILTFILVVSLVAYFTFTQKKMYSATSSLIVDVVTVTSGIGISDFSGSASRNLQNELEILKSRNLKMEVAKNLIDIFYIDPDGRRDTISVVKSGMVQGNITNTNSPQLPSYVISKLGEITTFEMGKEKDIIEITTVSHFPEEAALIANVYAQTYYERDLRRSRSNATEVRTFLQDQTANRMDTLRKSETQLLNYMQNENVVELEDKSRFLIMKITDLESEIEKNQIEMRKSKVLLTQYKEQLQSLVPSVTSKIINVDDLYIKELQEKVARMEADLDVSKVVNRADSSRAKYIKEISRQEKTIDSLRSILKARTREYIAGVTSSVGYSSNNSRDGATTLTNLSNKIQDTQLDIVTLEVSLENLNKSLSEYERDFNRIPKQQVTLARLQRQKDFNEKLYLKLGEEFQSSLLSELSTFGRVEILDEAIVPHKPYSPRYAINLAIGMFLGVLFGVFVAFAIDFFFSYVRSPHDVESLGFRLISTIPKIPANGGGRKLLGAKKDPNSRQLLEPSSSNLVAQESYQRLQIYLNYGFLDKEVKSLVVSSSGPGEGKSSTAANFAVSLANSGKKVLLVDMDLRKPVIHKFFDLPQSPTLIHYLYKKCELSEIIKKTNVNNLFVVTAVEFNQNPALIFTSSALQEFMESMKKRFDYVIYDTPPVNAVTDAIHLARLVDETILIARADQTNVDELNRAAKLFEQFNISVGGVVLNDFDDAKLPSYYGRYYGFYTKDGEKVKKKRKKNNKDVIFDN